MHDLVDLRGVDVDVDLARARGEGVEPAGDAIVEARADVHHHVAIVHRHVGFIRAVHAEHAHPVVAGGRVGAEPHERRRDGEARRCHQFAQQLARLGPGIDDAAARIEDRPLRPRHQGERLADALVAPFPARPVGDVRLRLARRGVGAGRELHVLGDIDDDRTGAPGGRDVERLVQHAGEIVHVLHQPVVLGAGARDADRVAFLEGVGADERGRHLPGDAHEGNRIHQRVLQGRDHVGGAGAGGDEHDARLVRRAGVAFRGVARALLVPHQDVPDRVLLVQFVVDRQHRAAGIAEQVGDAVVLQRLDDHLRARHAALAVHSLFHRPVPRAPRGRMHP